MQGRSELGKSVFVFYALLATRFTLRLGRVTRRGARRYVPINVTVLRALFIRLSKRKTFDAADKYDEPVDWAMTEGGPLPTVSNSDVEAAIHSTRSNSASGPSSMSNDPLPSDPSTRRKLGTSKGTKGAMPLTAPPQALPTKTIPKSRNTNMPPRTRTCEPTPYRSQRQPHP